MMLTEWRVIVSVLWGMTEAGWWMVCSVVKLKDVFTSKREGHSDWEVDVECCLIFPVYDLRLGMVC